MGMGRSVNSSELHSTPTSALGEGAGSQLCTGSWNSLRVKSTDVEGSSKSSEDSDSSLMSVYTILSSLVGINSTVRQSELLRSFGRGQSE